MKVITFEVEMLNLDYEIEELSDTDLDCLVEVNEGQIKIIIVYS